MKQEPTVLIPATKAGRALIMKSPWRSSALGTPLSSTDP